MDVPLNRTMDEAERCQRQRQHIFVVNGASEFLDIVRELLESEEYNVTTTNFVPQTFDVIVALDPSLVILDLAIHVRAGWELLEQLHNAVVTNTIPVIVVSTVPEYLERVQADGARYGAQRFLGKPFDIDDLLGAVAELIGPA
jgi:DNA-binding response OmpR family regulator